MTQERIYSSKRNTRFMGVQGSEEQMQKPWARADYYKCDISGMNGLHVISAVKHML